MSNLETNLRQSNIIKRLRKNSTTFDEIQEVLGKHHDYNLQCSIRTFQRDVKDIASLYNIQITYSRSKKVYAITEDKNSEHQEDLLETFDLQNTLKNTERHAKETVFKKAPPSRNKKSARVAARNSKPFRSFFFE